MRITILLFLVLSMFDVFAQKNFLITVNISNIDSGSYPMYTHMLVSETKDTILQKDSVSRQHCSCSISGFLREERYMYISVRRLGEFDFGIGPGDTATIYVKAKSFRNDFKVEGSQRVIQSANYINGRFISQADELRKQKTYLDSLYLHNGDEKILNNSSNKFDSLFKAYFYYNTHFADTTMSAVGAAMALDNYINEKGKYNIYPNISKAINRFGEITPIKSIIKDYNVRASSKTALKAGDTLFVEKYFSKEIINDIVEASEKSKLLLIDFWASWCEPCIKEFVFLDSAYLKFHKKGFEIVSISLDDDATTWQEAVKKLKPSWKYQFLEKNPWESKVVLELNIKSIPRNFLIDKYGRIYAKDVRQQQLQEMLNKLL